MKDEEVNQTLIIKKLTKSYGLLKKNKVLNGVDLVLEKGKCICIVGENGTGKTTLLKIVGGLLPYSSGKVTVRGKISYVPEISSFFPYLTAGENMEYFDTLTGGSGRYKDMLDQVAVPIKGKNMVYFSKGMKRKIDIVRALNADPSLLILDEPFDGIDPSSNKSIIEMLKKSMETGVSIIMSSHDMSYVERIADQIMLLKDGVFKDISMINKYEKRLVVEGDEKVIEDLMKNFSGIVLKRDREFVLCLEKSNSANDLLKKLLDNGVRYIGEETESLEQIYIKNL